MRQGALCVSLVALVLFPLALWGEGAQVQNFDADPLTNWELSESAKLVPDGAGRALSFSGKGFASWYSLNLTDFQLHFRYRHSEGAEAALQLRASGEPPDTQYYLVRIAGERISIARRRDRQVQQLAQGQADIRPGAWTEVEVGLQGGEIRVLVNKELVAQAVDPEPIAKPGSVVLLCDSGAGIAFDDVTVAPGPASGGMAIIQGTVLKPRDETKVVAGFQVSMGAPFTTTYKPVGTGKYRFLAVPAAPGLLTVRLQGPGLEPVERAAEVQAQVTAGTEYQIIISSAGGAPGQVVPGQLIVGPMADSGGGAVAVIPTPLPKPQATPIPLPGPVANLSLVSVRTQKDWLTPLVVQLARRYLANVPDKNEADMAFANALAARGGIDTSALTHAVQAYDAMPPKKRQAAFGGVSVANAPLAPVTRQQVETALGASGVSIVAANGATVASGGVGAIATFLAPPPELTRIATTEPPGGFAPGDLLTLEGKGFSPNPKENGVRIWPPDPLAKTSAFDVVPLTANANQLQFQLPQGIGNGVWRLEVLVGANHKPSTQLAFSVKVPPPPPLQVASLSPAEQKPGQLVFVNGSGFDPGKAQFVKLTNLGAIPPQSHYPVIAEVVNQGQLKFTLPNDLLPGQYAAQVMRLDGVSNNASYKVGAYKYAIRADQVHCLDESDPEDVGDDEIVTFWVVAVDGLPVLPPKNTGEYEDFEDGKTEAYKPQDAVVLDYTEVSQGLSLSTDLFEWDEGEVETAAKIAGVAGEIGKWALGTAFGKGVGEAFGAVAGAVAKALPEIAKLFGVGNDHLGQRVHTWNVQELATGVPPGQSKTFKDEFLNDDDTGSYDVTFTILCQP